MSSLEQFNESVNLNLEQKLLIAIYRFSIIIVLYRNGTVICLYKQIVL